MFWCRSKKNVEQRKVFIWTVSYSYARTFQLGYDPFITPTHPSREVPLVVLIAHAAWCISQDLKFKNASSAAEPTIQLSAWESSSALGIHTRTQIIESLVPLLAFLNFTLWNSKHSGAGVSKHAMVLSWLSVATVTIACGILVGSSPQSFVPWVVGGWALLALPNPPVATTQLAYTVPDTPHYKSFVSRFHLLSKKLCSNTHDTYVV